MKSKNELHSNIFLYLLIEIVLAAGTSAWWFVILKDKVQVPGLIVLTGIIPILFIVGGYLLYNTRNPLFLFSQWVLLAVLSFPVTLQNGYLYCIVWIVFLLFAYQSIQINKLQAISLHQKGIAVFFTVTIATIISLCIYFFFYPAIMNFVTFPGYFREDGTFPVIYSGASLFITALATVLFCASTYGHIKHSSFWCVLPYVIISVMMVFVYMAFFYFDFHYLFFFLCGGILVSILLPKYQSSLRSRENISVSQQMKEIFYLNKSLSIFLFLLAEGLFACTAGYWLYGIWNDSWGVFHALFIISGCVFCFVRNKWFLTMLVACQIAYACYVASYQIFLFGLPLIFIVFLMTVILEYYRFSKPKEEFRIFKLCILSLFCIGFTALISIVYNGLVFYKFAQYDYVSFRYIVFFTALFFCTSYFLGYTTILSKTNKISITMFFPALYFFLLFLSQIKASLFVIIGLLQISLPLFGFLFLTFYFSRKHILSLMERNGTPRTVISEKP